MATSLLNGLVSTLDEFAFDPIRFLLSAKLIDMSRYRWPDRPKRALRSSLATPKGLGVSDPTATDVRYASKADLALALPNVRLVPITDVCLFRASEPDCELLPLN